MNRLIWIPVAGTVAALVAILLARAPREESPYPMAPPRAEPSEPLDEEPPEFPEPPVEADPQPPRPPQPADEPARTHILRLDPDGALTDAESGERYASAEELLDSIAPEGAPRPRIVVTNASAEVSEAFMDEVLARLRERCDVRKDYSGPQEEDD